MNNNRIVFGIFVLLSIIIIVINNCATPAHAQHVASTSRDFQNVSLDLDKDNLFDIHDFSLTTSRFETENNTWTPIFGDKIFVESDESFIVISHLKLNKYVMQSHIVISGYNENTKEWSQILQCPSGFNGPLELNRFVCNFTIPKDISQIQPVFQTGWSNESGKEAKTTFGKFFLIKEPPYNTPVVFDNKLEVQEVFHNNLTSTAMKFIGVNDILLTDQMNGTVYRYLNGSLLGPLVDFTTAGDGLTGLESAEKNGTRYVFLYVTLSGGSNDGDDDTKDIPPKCNCLYRYELVNSSLINPKLLFSLPAYLGNGHSGGVIRIDNNDNIFLMTGSLDAEEKIHEPQLINNEMNGSSPDGRSGILRLTYDGDPVDGILGKSYPLNLYYAYGIRNGFGMDFDPLTGNLWDTENGPDTGDEVNLVVPGFNSGFKEINGIWKYGTTNGEEEGYIPTLNPTGLVDFNGSGIYRSPELAWERTVGVVALGFLNSSKLGGNYSDSVFISDFNNHNLYNFKLNNNRTGLELFGPLSDKVVNSTNIINNYTEINSNIFGMGMGLIVDIKTGPDGYLYLLKMNDGSGGKLYRVVPTTRS